MCGLGGSSDTKPTIKNSTWVNPHMTTTARTRYDGLSITFHWLTAVTVAIAFALGPGDFPELVKQGADPATHLDVVWHESLGVLIFTLTFLRLIWVSLRPRPPNSQAAKWMVLAAKTVHVALWTLLLALPISAVLGLMTEGNPLTLLGGLRVNPSTFIANSVLNGLVDWGEVHKLLGTAIMWLAGLHAGAALFHHFKLKDGVFRFMLP